MPAADLVAVAYVVTTSLYGGFQLAVWRLAYPLLAAAGALAAAGGRPEQFVHVERMENRLATPPVAVVFPALVVTVVLVLRSSPGAPLAWLGALATAALLATTAFGAVPAHRALGRGWDPGAVARLQRWDRVRVACAAVQFAAAVGLVVTWRG